MITHIVAWAHRDTFSAEQKTAHGLEIQQRLEGLLGVVDGLLSMKVTLAPLPKSTHDMLLESTFESREALDNYTVHPVHKEISAFVRSVTVNRFCFDYEI